MCSESVIQCQEYISDVMLFMCELAKCAYVPNSIVVVVVIVVGSPAAFRTNVFCVGITE